MKIVDLSQTIAETTPVYPDNEPVAIQHLKTLEKDQYNAFILKTGMHVGTHLDVPMHMLPDSRMVDSFPLDSFVGKGVILDVRGQKRIRYQKEYDSMIFKNDIVLLFTGFDEHFENRQLYFGGHPVVEEDLAEFLVAKHIKMLGVDMPSPDMRPYPTHKTLLSNGIFVLENLTNLSAVNDFERFQIVAAPLKIKAEASLVRAFAIID